MCQKILHLLIPISSQRATERLWFRMKTRLKINDCNDDFEFGQSHLVKSYSADAFACTIETKVYVWRIVFFLEWISRMSFFCFIYTCTENVRSIFDDIRRLDRYEMLRCGTVQIVPNCLPDVYFIIYLMFTLSSHYITLPRSYSIIEHVTWSHFMSCDDHVTHREDLSYSNNVLDDRWSTIAVKSGLIQRKIQNFHF